VGATAAAKKTMLPSSPAARQISSSVEIVIPVSCPGKQGFDLLMSIAAACCSITAKLLL
jgi:hypothetical protein